MRKDQMTTVILKTNANQHRDGHRNQTQKASKNPAQDSKSKVAINTFLQMKSPSSTRSNLRRVRIQKEREIGDHSTRRDQYLRHLQTGSVVDNTRGVSIIPVVVGTMKSLHWNQGQWERGTVEVTKAREPVRGKWVPALGIMGQRLIGGRWVMGLTMIIGERKRGITGEGGGSIEKFL
jgi:hypothetical protein